MTSAAIFKAGAWSDHESAAGGVGRVWSWSCFVGGARGSTETKDEAVFEVERTYTRTVGRADWPK